MSGAAVAGGARAMIGVPFRLHGRDATGLDCVGLVAVALRAAGFEGAVPTGYALRGGDPAAVAARLDAALRRGGKGAQAGAAGDVLLFAVGAAQLHLAIRTEGGFVHADAALRRVVERPGPAPWPLIGAWTIGE